MRLILDAGAFIALGRDDRAIWRRLKAARRTGQLPVTHGGVVGQVWRGGGARQALLARALNGIDVRALDEQLGRRSGALLARTGTSDVIDAALVLLAEDTDHIATSDLSDLRVLAEAAARHVELIPV
ncbi:MAG: twitching motility protein PilT [Actinomycetota bacterium]|nr:twitching motility protein PilT [Actinomycetota bacterium]